MQIVSLDVKGLFRRFNHHVVFPEVSSNSSRGAVAILHGANGVGKTTMLRMLDGVLGERRPGAWDIFRTVPFSVCTIHLSGVPPFSISPQDVDGKAALELSFDGMTALVGRSVEERGGITPRDVEAVRHLDQQFELARSDLSFELTETSRVERLDIRENDAAPARLSSGSYYEAVLRRAYLSRGITEPERRLLVVEPLSARMAQFISSAQLNSRSFFASSGPDLFSQIIERLTAPQTGPESLTDLLRRVEDISSLDKKTDRLGLERDQWDPEELKRVLLALPESGEVRENALAVARQFIEMLESKAAERSLIADRLYMFEAVMDEFFSGKRVVVTSKDGLRLETDEGLVLDEHQLSSGERHLLFLMVSAVTAKGRGTVLAIDEPELSMHIAWQRQLIPALLRCAAKAEPQFIFATHSPDLAGKYQDSLIELA